MAALADWGNVSTVILKIKISVGSKEKGWFLHKDIAVKILSGQDQCFPLQCVLEMIRIDDAVEFNSKVDASVHIKDGSSWMQNLMSMQLCDLEGMQHLYFYGGIFITRDTPWMFWSSIQLKSCSDDCW